MSRALRLPSAKNKYGAVRSNGHDSKREAKRAAELRLLEKCGAISGLEQQVRYELIPAQYRDGKCVERSCSYVADFLYWEKGERICEDSKGVRTPDYKIKRKLMLKIYGIRIKET